MYVQLANAGVLQSLKCQVFKILSLSVSTELSSDYAWISLSPTANTLNNISSLFTLDTIFAMTFTSKIPGIRELVLKLWHQTSHFSLDSSFTLSSFHTFPYLELVKHYIIFENGLEVGKLHLYAGIYSVYLDMTVQEERASSGNSANL